MVTIRRVLTSACCTLALSGGVASAQDEVQTFNAFAVMAANGTIIRAAEKQVMIVATLTGAILHRDRRGADSQWTCHVCGVGAG